MLKSMKTGVSTSKRVYFRVFLALRLLSWRRARVFARSCSLLSKYLPISWKQRKEQSHAQCHVTHRIRIFDKISEHVKVAKSVDIAVLELVVTKLQLKLIKVVDYARMTSSVEYFETLSKILDFPAKSRYLLKPLINP